MTPRGLGRPAGVTGLAGVPRPAGSTTWDPVLIAAREAWDAVEDAR